MYILHVFRRYRRELDTNDGRLLRIQINKEALEHNVRQFSSLFRNHALAAVLKSNAYGHDLALMGRFFDAHRDISFLVVDNIIEAETLRDQGVKKSILILGYITSSALPRLKRLRKTTLVVNSLEQARELSRRTRFSLPVHVKVDTGMHRQGIHLNEISAAIRVLQENSHIRITGMLSHLADPDQGLQTQAQLSQWNTAVGLYRQFVGEGLFHFSATAGTRFVHNAPNSMIRAGIGLYGFDTTTDKRLGVKPILSFWSKLASIRRIEKGGGVGYGFDYTAQKDAVLGVLPCGYYEGIARCLGNKGFVYYHQTPLPIVGRVSMNLTTIDLTDVAQECALEEELEVFSDNPEQKNSIEYAAQLCGTIPYEMLVRIPPTIRRELI